MVIFVCIIRHPSESGSYGLLFMVYVSVWSLVWEYGVWSMGVCASLGGGGRGEGASLDDIYKGFISHLVPPCLVC